MKNKFKMLEQKQLIQKLNQLSTLPPSFSRPKEGWIRTVRKALSMTTTQLAKKLGIKFLTGDKEFKDFDNVEFVK